MLRLAAHLVGDPFSVINQRRGRRADSHAWLRHIAAAPLLEVRRHAARGHHAARGGHAARGRRHAAPGAIEHAVEGAATPLAASLAGEHALMCRRVQRLRGGPWPRPPDRESLGYEHLVRQERRPVRPPRAAEHRCNRPAAVRTWTCTAEM